MEKVNYGKIGTVVAKVAQYEYSYVTGHVIHIILGRIDIC